MTKLRFTRTVAEYHPASGLELQPGVADYPDDLVAVLKLAGLEVVDDVVKVEDAPEARRKGSK